ncbi:MAG: LapA family protein [bacterium]|nr:LapA family protein [bacterium]
MRTYSRQTSDVSFSRQEKRFRSELAGSVHMPLLSVLLIIFVIGGGYLYFVNRSAVMGYHLRTLEKEISALKQENAELKISEADLRSLYRIEASGEELHMQKLDTITYLEERESSALSASLPASPSLGGPVALK